MKLFATVLVLGVTANISFGQGLLDKMKSKATTATTTAEASTSAAAGTAQSDASSASSSASAATTKASATAAKSGSSMPSLSNLSGSKDAIMGKLTPALALTEIQKPAVTSAIEGFLKKKASIAPLATSDKPSYTSKLGALKTTLFGQIKSAVTSGQYTKFLKLKPKAPSATNALTNLFY